MEFPRAASPYDRLPSEHDKLDRSWQSHNSMVRTSFDLSPSPGTQTIKRPLSWIRSRHDRTGSSLSRSRNILPHTIHCKCTLLRVILRIIFLVAISLLSLSAHKSIFNPSYAQAPQHYLDLEQQTKASTKAGRGNINNEKVFIAANILNADLIRGAWGDNLISLIDLLGEDNVFVSIYENDSGNSTSDALRQLQRQLKCNSSIVTGGHVPLAGFPTTRLPNGDERVQRLTYLAEIRNRLLRPIDPTYHDISTNGFRSATNIKFDRILFLNDVYYSPLEAVQLLFSTNAASGQAQYRAACAIDFVQLFKLYDSFVVRDTDGHRIALQFFPWFTHRDSGTSRKDVLSLTDAVRVRSCWGGMAAFDAKAFQPQPTSQSTISPDNSTQLSLKFRSDGEPFWEAAECCLIFADMEEQLGKPSKYDGTGVFINPYVRTAYSATTWRWIPFFRRFERIFEPYQFLVDLCKPPEWNPRRTHTPGQMVDEVVWVDSNITTPNLNPHYRNYAETRRFGHFEVQHRPAAVGGFCGERRMFVMKTDLEAANQNHRGRNWEDIHVPWHFEINAP